MLKVTYYAKLLQMKPEQQLLERILSASVPCPDNGGTVMGRSIPFGVLSINHKYLISKG